MLADEVESEIHFMKTYSIMKWDELIKLNDDRKSLNQKITLGLATKEELMKQIKVELNMLDTCQLKIDQEMKENTEYINTEILTILSNRINDMYNSVFLLFPVEKTSLSEYIEFCSNNTLFITKCSNMLDTLMTRYHSDPEVYITAATYEFDDRNDVESARKYFAEGLKYHKNCKNLYVEEFWVEVQHLEKTAGASLPIAIGKYRNLIKIFEGDIEFHFILLDRAIKLSAVRELQCNVVRDMVKKYRHSELMWQKLAKIHFDGFIYHQETEQLHYDKNYISGIRNCIKTYENGLKENLPLKNKHKLWNFYIDHIIEIRKSYRMKKETIRNFMNDTMERAFQEAHDNKALIKAQHYIYWAENTNKNCHRILRKAVDVIQDSVELWITLISYYLNYDSLEMAIESFQAGVRALTSKSMPLWEILILYMGNTHPKLLQQLYHEGSHFPFPEINFVIRPEYLEWSVVHNGILSTRELFIELRDIKPECKQLYTTMISFELTQSSKITKLKTIRKLYNDVCNAFGQTDIGVWSDCIRFEYMYGSHKLVKEIYQASLLCLVPDLRSGMTQEFEKLKEEFMEDEPKDGGIIVIDDDE
ncbi:U3 small nucleolar RNA-associated protein 6 homolog isoform X1 [Metopolophium dirhodum]|uniref:U3 small nucleolar RNA-associated protein 6 homolog isoform X1 n=2 Tax=Metopolophium dirhodum TaxID=44670 RepID=UPI00298FFE4D|nr:U3 small nucleolar RNA-associated protein 6 homolog isoform X1 [Metopolophium dirhodum]XP_060857110.1 U3 small nucleolar RNA-associated protein 6 homolog isoform X1 [Metopolophium dirhodum]XP_060857111.1 U3 small nucleolar RNA-associated protein 6 homolog isoform X1 [Metopolophium dirhodum]XP_060857112.1 U3 small nucleolar RNA-associated protein 6 homolog isoform X1 [Metopolophium dirhodum]XP_060857113.1 U3 small nucleolar RNA-associated protein 6 homolog isoform X1 [Metopolophium dirhodum]